VLQILTPDLALVVGIAAAAAAALHN